MHNSWKKIYISKMNFINPELIFKIETRKIKTRDIHNSKKEIHKLYFQIILSIHELHNPWKHI
jgi:hypothetical protein